MFIFFGMVDVGKLGFQLVIVFIFARLMLNEVPEKHKNIRFGQLFSEQPRLAHPV